MIIKLYLASLLALPSILIPVLCELLPGKKKGKLVIWEWFSSFYLFGYLPVAEVLSGAYWEQLNCQRRHRLTWAGAGRANPVLYGNLAFTSSTFPWCTCSYCCSGDRTKSREPGYSLSLSPNRRVISPGSVCSLLYLALDLSLKHPQFQPLGKPGENRSPWLCLKAERMCCSHSWWKHPFCFF